MTTSCLLPSSVFPLLEALDGVTGHVVSTIFLSGSMQVWLPVHDHWTEQRLKAIIASLETEHWVFPYVPILNGQGLISYMQVASTEKLQTMNRSIQSQKIHPQTLCGMGC